MRVFGGNPSAIFGAGRNEPGVEHGDKVGRAFSTSGELIWDETMHGTHAKFA